MKLLTRLIFALIIYVGLAGQAEAYLDPGSGSFIFQMIVGAVLGAAVALKVYFGRVKQLALKLFRKNSKDDSKK